MCIKLPLVSAIAYSLGLLLVGNASMLQAQQASNEAVDFVQDVKPILAKHCYACHGPDESEGGD